jgi:hypothetical protein
MEQNDQENHVEHRPKCCENVGQEEASITLMYIWNFTKWPPVHPIET